ncbi:MAG: hypothetical protein ABI574_00030 [Burkholderiales bacterium]
MAIKLNMSKRIAFIGSANALGMMYAIELRAAGVDVTYFVTTTEVDTLSRPENHYPEVGVPYEKWVIEYIVKNPLRANIFPHLYIGGLVRELKTFDFVFLSGMYLMLAPIVSPAKAVFLSHGSDLDVWCDKKSYGLWLQEIRRGSAMVGSLFSLIGVAKMRKAFKSCAALITFPFGLSSDRDRVVRDISRNWRGRLVERFDVSFSPVSMSDKKPPFHENRLVLLCAVRCSFLPSPGRSPSDMKGVDVILKGVEKYIDERRLPVVLHIVEKGVDLELAKKIVSSGALRENVVWHKEMPFNKLLTLYEEADICFDQTSTSWLGAIGVYALYMGRPLIANSRSEVLGHMWTGSNPICEAVSSAQVRDCLVALESVEVRKEVSERSKVFAKTNLGPSRVVGEILDFI